MRGGRERQNGKKLTSKLIPENAKHHKENAIERVARGGGILWEGNQDWPL